MKKLVGVKIDIEKLKDAQKQAIENDISFSELVEKCLEMHMCYLERR